MSQEHSDYKSELLAQIWWLVDNKIKMCVCVCVWGGGGGGGGIAHWQTENKMSSTWEEQDVNSSTSDAVHITPCPNCWRVHPPPIIVLMREAWPGQSTSVYWSFSSRPSCRCSGRSTVKEEKPRSSVIPLSLLCGFLSKLAVLATVLKAFAKLVLPLSIWPKTPTLKFSVFTAAMLTQKSASSAKFDDHWKWRKTTNIT